MVRYEINKEGGEAPKTSFEKTLDTFRLVQPGQSVRFQIELNDFEINLTVIGDRGEIVVHHTGLDSDFTSIDKLRDYLETEFSEDALMIDDIRLTNNPLKAAPELATVTSAALHAEMTKLRARLAATEDLAFVTEVLDQDVTDEQVEHHDGITVGKENGVMRQRYYHPDYFKFRDNIDVSGSKGAAKMTLGKLSTLFTYDYDPLDNERQSRTWSQRSSPLELSEADWTNRAKALGLDLRGFTFNLVKKPLQGIRPGMDMGDGVEASKASVPQLEITLNLSARARATGQNEAVAEMRALIAIIGSLANNHLNSAFNETIKGSVSSGGIDAGRIRFIVIDSSRKEGKEIVRIEQPTITRKEISEQLAAAGIATK